MRWPLKLPSCARCSVPKLTSAQRGLVNRAKRELRSLEPGVRRSYLASLAQLLRTVPSETLAERIVSGVPLLDLLPARALDRAFVPFQQALRDGASRGFSVATGMLNPRTGSRAGGTLGISFNTLSPRVLGGIARMEDFILRTAKQEVRETVRAAVEAGLQAGKNPRDIARGIRDVVGLAPSHEQHVRNFRRKLEAVRDGSREAFGNKLRDRRFDAAIKTALKNGKGLAPAVIDNMVAAYARRYTNWHAETVARTATLNAFRAGQQASIDSAIEMDLMTAQDVVKIWTTVGDDRVRDEHVAMEGEEVPFDAPFSNGLMIPSEWNCRCIVLYEFRPAGSRSREEALKLLRARDKGEAPPAPAPAPVPPPAPPPPPPVPLPRSLSERLTDPETTAEREWLDAQVASPAQSFSELRASIASVRTLDVRESIGLQIMDEVPERLAMQVDKIAAEIDDLFGPMTLPRNLAVQYNNAEEAFFNVNRVVFGRGYYSSASTIAHELTHAYESLSPALISWQERMLLKYSDGRPSRDITALVAPGHPDRIIGYTGRFIRNYQGRYYPNGGRVYAAEFLTVAMELLYTDPAKFARLHPEMYRDVLQLFYRINRS